MFSRNHLENDPSESSAQTIEQAINDLTDKDQEVVDNIAQADQESRERADEWVEAAEERAFDSLVSANNSTGTGCELTKTKRPDNPVQSTADLQQQVGDQICQRSVGLTTNQGSAGAEGVYVGLCALHEVRDGRNVAAERLGCCRVVCCRGICAEGGGGGVCKC